MPALDSFGEGTITARVIADTRQVDAIFNKQRNFKANFSDFAPLGHIARSASQVEKSLEAANARVLAFGASAGVFALVSASLRKIVTDTVNVEKSLLDINVILGASAGRLKEFSSALFDIAKNTGQSFDTAADAAKEFSRQGLSLEDTLKRTNAALVLTRISGLDGAKSVTALTTAINSFNKEALTQEDVVNRLANVDAKFAVSSEDLANALSVGGAAAQAAGVSLNEFLAIVTSVKQKTGQSGNQIANALKGIFVRTGRSDTLDELEKVGVAVRDLAGNTLPGVKILQNLANVQDNLSDSQKAYIDDLTAGTYRVNQLKAALSDVSKTTGIYAGALKAANSQSNAAFDRSDKLNQKLEAQANVAKQNITKIFSDIGGDLFGPALKELFSGINKVADSGTIGSDLGKGIIKGLGDFLAGPGLIIIGGIVGKLFGRFIKDAASALSSINKIGTQLENLNPILDKIISKESASLGKEQSKLKVIEAQTAALQKQASVTNSLTTNPISRTPINSARITQGGGRVSSRFEENRPGGIGGRIVPSTFSLGSSSGGFTPAIIRPLSNLPGNTSGIPSFLRSALGIGGQSSLFQNIDIPKGATNRNKIRNQISSLDKARQTPDFNYRSSFQPLPLSPLELERKKQRAFSLLEEENRNVIPPDRRLFGGVRDSLRGAKDSLIRTRNIRGTGAGLGLGLAGSVIGESIGGGKGEAISNVSNAVGTGAAIAAISPNAIGVAIAAIVTSLKLFKTALDSASGSIANRDKDDKKKILDNQTQLSNAKDLSQAFAKIKEQSRGSKSVDFGSTKEFRNALLNAPPSLLRSLPNQKNLLSNSQDDIDKALARFESEKESDAKRREALIQIRGNLGGEGVNSGIKNPGSILEQLRKGDFLGKASNEDLSQARSVLDNAKGSKDSVAAVREAIRIGQLKIPDADINKLATGLNASTPEVLNKVTKGLSDFFAEIININNQIEKIKPSNTSSNGTLFNAAGVSDNIRNRYSADALRRSSSLDSNNARVESRLAIEEALNSASSSPLSDISNKFSSERIKGSRLDINKLELDKDASRELIASFRDNIAGFSQTSKTRNQLADVIGSGSTSDNPAVELAKISDILQRVTSNKDVEDAIEKVEKRIFESQQVAQKIDIKAALTNQTLAKIESIEKARILADKLQSNFGGTGALSSQQDLSEISGGRRAQFQNILEANNPRFQQNRALELQNSADPNSVRERNRQTQLGRSNAIGRGILSSVESGSLPSAIEISGLKDENRKNSLTKFLDSQRSQLKGAYFNDANDRLNQDAGDVISNLRGAVGNSQFQSLFSDQGTFSPDKTFEKAGTSAQSGNLKDVESKLNELLKRSTGENRGVIQTALSQIQGLNFQKGLLDTSATLRANTAIPTGDNENGPLSKKGVIEALAVYFTPGGGNAQAQAPQSNSEREQLKKSLQELTDQIKSVSNISNESIISGVGARVGEAVKTNSEISAKVEVAVRGADADGSGSITQEEMKDFQKKMELYIKEYFETKGNPAPRTPATK